jgi:LmbE family N-acetylglucosaminyl deacetylase
LLLDSTRFISLEWLLILPIRHDLCFILPLSEVDSIAQVIQGVSKATTAHHNHTPLHIMLKKSFIFLLLAIPLLVVIHFLLAAKYNYDVTQDYRYALQNSVHELIEVDVRNGIFQVNDSKNWDTGFIKVKVAATLTGYFAEPSVEIISEKQRSILTLERGVRGERFINLPASKQPGNIHFQLIAHHLSIQDQHAGVVLFANPKMQDHPRVLVIAPHPDDAEIAAFGLYSAFDSLILTITAGEAGPYKYDEIYLNAKQQFEKKGTLRVWNSITVPLLGGVMPEHAINLGYFDGTLQTMAENKGKSAHSLYTDIQDVNFFRRQNLSRLTPPSEGKANWPSLVADIEQIILAFNPDIIVTPYPAIESHPDHKFSTVAVIEALQGINRQQGQLFLYTNHATASDYFPYGQQGELVSIVPDLNNSLYFNSIYSFDLVEPKDKILALDAMNELRLDTSWLTITGALKILTKTLSNKLMLNDTTYFRRGARANELFLVVNVSSLYRAETIRALYERK